MTFLLLLKMDRDNIIKGFTRKPVTHKLPVILNFCTAKSVLDIGCIGQDLDPDNPAWLHGKIKQVAKDLAGVDANLAKIEILRKSGYKIFSPESITKDAVADPDIILMADVIEHVSDILSFLLFYKKMATEKTLTLISTPNPYSIRQSVSILLFGRPGLNPEHTVAIDPTNMLEIISRSGLEVVDFMWLHEYTRPKKLYNKILFVLYRMLYSCRKFWAPNYLIVVKLPA